MSKVTKKIAFCYSASHKNLTNLTVTRSGFFSSYFWGCFCILVGGTSLSIGKGFKVVSCIAMVGNF